MANYSRNAANNVAKKTIRYTKTSGGSVVDGAWDVLTVAVPIVGGSAVAFKAFTYKNEDIVELQNSAYDNFCGIS